MDNDPLFPKKLNQSKDEVDYITVTVGGGYGGTHVVRRLFAKPGTEFEVKRAILCKICLPDMLLFEIVFLDPPAEIASLPVVLREQYGDVNLLLEVDNEAFMNPDFVKQID